MYSKNARRYCQKKFLRSASPLDNILLYLKLREGSVKGDSLSGQVPLTIPPVFQIQDGVVKANSIWQNLPAFQNTGSYWKEILLVGMFPLQYFLVFSNTGKYCQKNPRRVFYLDSTFLYVRIQGGIVNGNPLGGHVPFATLSYVVQFKKMLAKDIA